MLCKEIIDRMENAYPKEYALEWDNVGLLVGRDDKEIQRIYIALDATKEEIARAVERQADMMITHHPMFFGNVRAVNNLDYTGERILSLIQHDISYYAAHTNYDVLGMAELAAHKMKFQDMRVLQITSEKDREGIGRIAQMKRPVTLKECCQIVKKAFQLDHVTVFGCPDSIVRCAAISPGSGKSVIGAAIRQRADVLITGDIGHHEGIDAASQGLAVIDAGHYGLEHIFIEDMRQFLERELKGVQVTPAEIRHPFQIV